MLVHVVVVVLLELLDRRRARHRRRLLSSRSGRHRLAGAGARGGRTTGAAGAGGRRHDDASKDKSRENPTGTIHGTPLAGLGFPSVFNRNLSLHCHLREANRDSIQGIFRN